MSLFKLPIRKFNTSLASLIFGSICIGLTIGWQENFLIHHVIASCSSEICYNVDKIKSRICLVINLGGCLGAFIPLCLVDVFGRRNNFIIAAVLDMICWLTLTLMHNSPFVFIGSAIGGLATGSFVVTATMYMGEVLPAQRRSTSAALVGFFVYTGILFSRILSLFVYNRIVTFTMIVVTLGFLVSIYHWMIESPCYLYERGETLKAKLALKHLRGAWNIFDIDSEYKSMEIFFGSNNESIHQQCNRIFSIFMIHKSRFWPNMILLLIITSQTIGGYAMYDYTETFFYKILPSYEKIILAFLDVLSMGMCIYLIQKIGRRYLLIISICGCSASCFFLATYCFIHETKYFVLSIYTDKILTIIIVICYCVSYSLGLTPIMPLLTGEVISNRIKTIVVGLCISLIYLGAMINQSVFEILNEHKGKYIASIAFTVIGSFGLFALFIFLPKTSTISHGIQNEMNDLTVFAS